MRFDGGRDEVDSSRRLVPVHVAEGRDVDRSIARDVQDGGAACRPGVISDRRIAELRDFVDRALEADLEWHAPDDHDNEGRVTFLPRYGATPLMLLDDDGVMGPVVELLGPAAEMYTMTTACQAPGGHGRSIHVDAVNQPPGYVFALGVLVLLDDFTSTSGTTRFYSEPTADPPIASEFDARARHLHAPAGSVCWFNAALWHDVLPNRGTTARRAIVIAMGRSGLRARFDMVRMLSHLDIDGLPPAVQRRLGLLSLPPGSYDEYYLPDAERPQAILRALRDRT